MSTETSSRASAHLRALFRMEPSPPLGSEQLLGASELLKGERGRSRGGGSGGALNFHSPTPAVDFRALQAPAWMGGGGGLQESRPEGISWIRQIPGIA